MSLVSVWHNPILMHTQRQSARVQRLPWVILASLVTITLLVAAIGGLAAENNDPAEVGMMLFNAFFGMAACVVTVAGAGFAGHGISSEFQGRTWETLLLTGMSPRRILVGKFFSALGNVLLYLVALAPVSALAFLFGGVSALEVAVAFVFLGALSALAAALGLAVSSAVPQFGAVVAVLSAMLAYLLVGIVVGFAGLVLVNAFFPSAHASSAIWWPAVLVRAPLDPHYVLYACCLPALAFGLATWLSFELAVAQVLEIGHDRYYFWKRALFVSMLLVSAWLAACQLVAKDERELTVVTVIGLSLHLAMAPALFIFVADDTYASRRARHELASAGALRRLLGPSVLRGAVLFLVVWMLGMLATSGIAAARLTTLSAPAQRPLELVLFNLVVIPFVLANAGMLVWFRVARYSPLTTRILVAVVDLAVIAAPWVLYAIAGGIASDSQALRVLAAPSPFYFFTMLRAVEPGAAAGDTTWVVGAGLVVAATYVALAMVFFALAAKRTRTALQAEIAYQRDVDQRLADEDAAALEAS